MNHIMKPTLAMLSILQLTAASNDIPTVLNDTLNQLIPDSSNTTIPILHIVTALSTAVSLSVSFFKYLFGFVVNVIQYLFAPFSWLFSTLWSQLVTKPFALFLHVMHILYPVLMFCVAAIGCGLFIGGCAGFAAEAFSNLLITATWGPQPKEKQPEDVVYIQEATIPEHPLDIDTEDDEPSHLTSPSSFFGTKKKSRKAQGKQPMNNNSSSNCSSRSSSPPVVIRRMKLSSTESHSSTRRRKNSWQWDEEEEDEDLYTDDGLRHRKKHF